jgi:hypothetical protein
MEGTKGRVRRYDLVVGRRGVRVERWGDGTRVVHVVTMTETATAWPSCGVFSTAVKGQVSTSPRDIP